MSETTIKVTRKDDGKVFRAHLQEGRLRNEGGLYLLLPLHHKEQPYFRNGKQLEAEFFMGEVELVEDNGRMVPVPETTRIANSDGKEEAPLEKPVKPILPPLKTVEKPTPRVGYSAAKGKRRAKARRDKPDQK